MNEKLIDQAKKRAKLLASILVAILFYLLVCEAAAVTKIPSTADEQIGRAMFTAKISSLQLVNDAQTIKTVTLVLKRLRTSKKLPWRVYIAIPWSAEVNAYSFGAGYILLPLGMLKICRTDAELAFVLSHEIAHGILRHVPQKIERSMDDAQIRQLLKLVKEVGNPKLPDDLIVALHFRRAIFKALSRAARKARKNVPKRVYPKKMRSPIKEQPSRNYFMETHAIRLGMERLRPFARKIKEINYNHEQELDADRLGVEIMKTAAFAVNAAVSLLQRLPQSSIWSTTHPSTERRIAAIQRLGPTQYVIPSSKLKIDIPASDKKRIKLAQEVLSILGYNPGIIDGIYGPRTRQAIEHFQKNMRLTVDGQVSDDLIVKLDIIIKEKYPQH